MSILTKEEITQTKKNIKRQIFAELNLILILFKYK